jgi:hypothetical protein
MQAVGLIEISAGLLVAAKPKRGGYVVGGMAGRYCRQSLDEAGVSGHRIARHRLALGPLASARMAADAPWERHMAELPA